MNNDNPDLCLNCGAQLVAGQAYCAGCGQSVASRRLTMHQIWHDLIHSVFHVDHSAFALLKALIGRPGGVARDYVDGMRKRYFGPFAFLVVSVSLASATIAVSGFTNVPLESDVSTVIARKIQSHINILYLLQMPILALLSLGLFRSSGRNFAEHLVLAAYSSAMRAVAVIALLIPLWLIIPHSAKPLWILFSGYFALWVAYYGIACTQFFPGNPLFTFVKGALVALLAQGFTLTVVSGANELITWAQQ